VGVDFDLERGWPRGGRGARAPGGFGGGGGQGGEVFLLEKDWVKKPKPWVWPPAAAHRVLLEAAPARRRLPSVQDANARSFHRRDEARRQRGDSGQALDEVEGHAFRREQGAGGAGHASEHGARFNAVSVRARRGKARRRGKL